MTIATTEIPRGTPVSGRKWKKAQTSRNSSQRTTATKVLSTSWKKKMEVREKMQRIKDKEREMKEEKKREIEDKKREKEEREIRQQKNLMKSTSYQVITKTHKLKTMSKKQLRNIKKTRMTKEGQVELVGMYEK